MTDQPSYLINVRSGVIHKVWDGATNESCNVDQIPGRERKTGTLEELQRDWSPRAKLCKRCFREVS